MTSSIVLIYRTWRSAGRRGVITMIPDRLRDVVQAEIDRAESEGADLIMLAYGLCGNGALGWHTEKATLVMPRFDDCVNMMLCTGKRDRRNYLSAGHMYLTGGWTKDEGALLDMFESYLSKYGKEKRTNS